MVVSLVSEAEWLIALRDLPGGAVDDAPLLVLAPHPDDETLAAGGLIAAQVERGAAVTVIAVTDGERAYGGVADAALGELRCGEQARALARLGVGHEKIVRLRLPDSRVAAQEQEIVERVLPMVSAATHIVAPWPRDFHPDHEACGRAAMEIARRSGARLSFWFFWTWHRGTPEMLQGLPLQRLVLSEGQRRAKLEALACHRSQLDATGQQRAGGEPILPDDLLAPAQREFEVFLPA